MIINPNHPQTPGSGDALIEAGAMQFLQTATDHFFHKTAWMQEMRHLRTDRSEHLRLQLVDNGKLAKERYPNVIFALVAERMRDGLARWCNQAGRPSELCANTLPEDDQHGNRISWPAYDALYESITNIQDDDDQRRAWVAKFIDNYIAGVYWNALPDEAQEAVIARFNLTPEAQAVHPNERAPKRRKPIEKEQADV